MNYFYYLGFIDLDEFIVPHDNYKSIPDMIYALDKAPNNYIASINLF
jgi:hypothetical protein